jgi:formate/nitrite transporter FocA (FNT family)
MTPAVVATFAVAKVVTPTFANIVARGIGCNILVCYASYFAVSSREIISKVVIIWACVATFVALGFDHVVANMLFVPLALMQGEVPFTIGYYVRPTTIIHGVVHGTDDSSRSCGSRSSLRGLGMRSEVPSWPSP